MNTLQALLDSLSPIDPREDTKVTGRKNAAAACTGRKNTAETIKRMSLAKLGKPPKSTETREKLSKALKGRPRPDIADILRGRSLSAECIAKRSASTAVTNQARREAKFAAHRVALEASLVNPVMLPAGHRVDLQATCLKYGLDFEMRAAFVGLRKKGLL